MAIDKIQSESINLADTFAFTGTVTGAGGVNTPAFDAQTPSNQSISDSTWTKVTFSTEKLDTNSAYDNSTNYRFTPQTAGEYFCYFHLSMQTGGSSGTFNYGEMKIYKNGSGYRTAYGDFSGNNATAMDFSIGSTINFNGSSDYIEAFALVDTNDGSVGTIVGSTGSFGAYKIIT